MSVGATTSASRRSAVPDWLVMIEAVTPESANAACDTLLAGDLRSAGASAEIVTGLYQLEICLTKMQATEAAYP